MDKDGIFSDAEMQQFRNWQDQARQRNLSMMKNLNPDEWNRYLKSLSVDMQRVVIGAITNPFYL